MQAQLVRADRDDLAEIADDVVDESVLARLVGGEPPVVQRVGEDPVERLPGVLGDQMDPETTVGALISERQYERVAALVEDGRNEGARLTTGGGRAPGTERDDALRGDWSGLVVFCAATSWDGVKGSDQHMAERLSRLALYYLQKKRLLNHAARFAADEQSTRDAIAACERGEASGIIVAWHCIGPSRSLSLPSSRRCGSRL